MDFRPTWGWGRNPTLSLTFLTKQQLFKKQKNRSVILFCPSRPDRVESPGGAGSFGKVSKLSFQQVLVCLIWTPDAAWVIKTNSGLLTARTRIGFNFNSWYLSLGISKSCPV